MKKRIKIVLGIILLAYFIYQISFFLIKEPSYATSNSNSESDVQLIARAINGEARGESYEGQVAVRCGYFKSSKRS